MSNQIKLYNSLTKRIEDFKPVHSGQVGMYHCGPTVYKRQHIGNMRRFLFADLLRRTFEFLGFDVKEVINITDVGHLTQDEIEAGEDKLEKEAKEKKVTPQTIAKTQTRQFLADIEALNIKPADKYPRATEHIEEMIKLIEKLIEKGYAYETNVGVFFDISRFKNYGALSGNTIEGLAAGKRLAVREEKKNPGDFALWLTDNPNHEQQWNSPWGRGYPGWHIECSAMSLKYLGEPIDIHTGGEDNKFPHHENEIAQSEGATGKKFVNYWIHNAHLQFDGKKLAKRAGEQITLDTIREAGYSPIVFRWLVLGSHYRSKMDFTWERMAEAQASLGGLQSLLRRIVEMGNNKKDEKEVDLVVINDFKTALADDLNSPKALAVVQAYINRANKLLTEENGKKNGNEQQRNKKLIGVFSTLLEMDKVLGVVEKLLEAIEMEKVPAAVQKIGAAREAARREGNYDKADNLKQKLEKRGYTVEDTPSGPRYIKK